MPFPLKQFFGGAPIASRRLLSDISESPEHGYGKASITPFMYNLLALLEASKSASSSYSEGHSTPPCPPSFDSAMDGVPFGFGIGWCSGLDMSCGVPTGLFSAAR
jgi:hypothetical protein